MKNRTQRRRFLQVIVGGTTGTVTAGCSIPNSVSDNSDSGDCQLPLNRLASEYQDWYTQCPNRWYSEMQNYIRDLGSVWLKTSPGWDAETLIRHATDLLLPAVDDVVVPEAASTMRDMLEATRESFDILVKSWQYLDTMTIRRRWDVRVENSIIAKQNYAYLEENTPISISREYNLENLSVSLDYAILPLFQIGVNAVPARELNTALNRLTKIQTILKGIIPKISVHDEFESALLRNLKNYEKAVNLLVAIYRRKIKQGPTTTTQKPVSAEGWVFQDDFTYTDSPFNHGWGEFTTNPNMEGCNSITMIDNDIMRNNAGSYDHCILYHDVSFNSEVAPRVVTRARSLRSNAGGEGKVIVHLMSGSYEKTNTQVASLLFQKISPRNILTVKTNGKSQRTTADKLSSASWEEMAVWYDGKKTYAGTKNDKFLEVNLSPPLSSTVRVALNNGSSVNEHDYVRVFAGGP